MGELAEIRRQLAALPEIQEASGETVHDLLSVAGEFAKLLRKLGVQQTRAGTDVVGSVRESMARLDDVHQAALDARDRAVRAERQAEKLATALIAHLDLVERAAAVMREAGGMNSWIEQFEKAEGQTLAEAAKWGLTTTGHEGETFDTSVHDALNEIEPTDAAVNVHRVQRRGWMLNGRVLRRARVEITAREEG